MSTPERRHFTPAVKVAILRKHLLEEKPVSEVFAEIGIPRTKVRPHRGEGHQQLRRRSAEGVQGGRMFRAM